MTSVKQTHTHWQPEPAHHFSGFNVENYYFSPQEDKFLHLLQVLWYEMPLKSWYDTDSNQ